MSRYKKPTAELKLQGTYREDKNGKNRADEILPIIIDFENTSVAVPKTIADDYVKSFFQTETEMLIKLHLLTPADLSEVESMCLLLQQMRQVQRQLKNIDISSNLDDYEILTKLYIKLSNAFSALAVRYYVSPVARSKIQMDALNIQKAKQDLELSPIQKLISKNK